MDATFKGDIMVGLMLEKNDAKVIVEVGFFQNDAIPSLQYHFGHWLSEDFAKMDADDLKKIFEVAEANVNGIYKFDKKYDYDCEATITDDITIRKFCCDDETDNPYFVEFPQAIECEFFGNCDICYKKCPWGLQ